MAPVGVEMYSFLYSAVRAVPPPASPSTPRRAHALWRAGKSTSAAQLMNSS